MLCCVADCGRDVLYKAKQICQKHYFRLWRYGTTDLTKPPTYRAENGKGYQMLMRPEHPLANASGYVFEHRAVMWDKLGGVMRPCELCGRRLSWATCAVDHIDNDVRNNVPGNLRPTCVPCNANRGRRAAIFRSNTHKVTYQGETKTPTEWARDPRVRVCGASIVRRIKQGMTHEQALFGEKKTHNGKKKRRANQLAKEST